MRSTLIHRLIERYIRDPFPLDDKTPMPPRWDAHLPAATVVETRHQDRQPRRTTRAQRLGRR